MSKHTASVEWQRSSSKFIDNIYSRVHTWTFDGGASILASASPDVVPVPCSNPDYIDPEEAFVASLSSCHMLWFLSIAAKNKFVVESYSDRAIGFMAKNEDGKLAITKVTLHPEVSFVGDNLPTTDIFKKMHDEAHHSCFIANSVKTEIVIEPLLVLKDEIPSR